MKNAVKVFEIFCAGMVVVGFVYPFLHEVGHAVPAWVLTRSVSFSLFPVPCVTCDITQANSCSICIVGLSGMLFPFAVSFVMKGKNFWMWLMSFFIKGISALAFLLSYIALLFFDVGQVWQNEDVIIIIANSGLKSSALLPPMLILLCIAIRLLCADRPLKRILNFLS